MTRLFIFVFIFIVGCTNMSSRSDHELLNNGKASSFIPAPQSSQEAFQARTWILLAESASKTWFYDPYSLIQDDDGIISFDAFIGPRELKDPKTYNPEIVGPYRQKLDCFSNHQWSETLYLQNISSEVVFVAGEIKPVNGTGWVKIKPKTAMAYIRSRLCGREFLDEPEVNYFLFQEGALLASPAPNSKSPIFYEVVNNEVIITDNKRDLRQMRLRSYVLNKDLAKQSDFIFLANCQENLYALNPNRSNLKLSQIGAKDSLSAVAFNRACGNHGTYMKILKKGLK